MNTKLIVSLLKAEIIYFQNQKEEYITSTDDSLYCDFPIEDSEIIRIEPLSEIDLLVTIK